jgi:ribonuclease D
LKLNRLENPYTYEIEQFQPNEFDLKKVDEPIKSPPSLEATTFKYIDELKDLIEMCEHLMDRSKVKEIAVDLEHHNYRSFLGFTCLMQISTRDCDYIIDTIRLRSELYRLNEPFTDFTLLKVLHGADFDIEWLQKDFGVFIVNMFDTGQACRVLQYPHFSLSYLLQRFCSIQADKKFQLADWRMRPLSDDMIKYAREDTHYLLYIYDNIKNELLKTNNNNNNNTGLEPILETYEKSKLICKKSYRKPQFYSKRFQTLCQYNSHLNAKQMKGLNDLYAWRDKIARETDESTEYVLKNHQLLKIAELLPREMYGILALCNPVSSIVESNVHEILDIVKKARQFQGVVTSLDTNPLVEVDDNNKIKQQEQQKLKNNETILDSIVHLASYDPNNIIDCPHDLPHSSDRNSNSQDGRHTDHSAMTTNQFELFKPLSSAEKKRDELLPNDLFILGDNDINQILSLENDEKTKKNKKLNEKVQVIKSSLKNPFEIFLPKELRRSNCENEGNVWTLLKQETKSTISATTSKADNQSIINNNESEANNDENLISLKKQSRLEKLTSNGRTKKKNLKNVDFTDAIIEYNKTKHQKNKEKALGCETIDDNINNDDDDDEQQSDVSKSIQKNLQFLSKSIRKESEAATLTKEKAHKNIQQLFSYDSKSINDKFSKAALQPNQQKQFDPTMLESYAPSSSNGKKNNAGSRVNKRRTTNALTRAKHTKSETFNTNK